MCVVCDELSDCYRLEEARTPQQRGLDPGAFGVVSSPVEDWLSEEADPGEIIEDDAEHESAVDENFYKKISISVTEKMRMRDVLAQLAQLAGINMFIAQDLEGNISFSAKDRPFIDILRDICSSSGLKYTIVGNAVKIEYDSPLLKSYRLPFLNLQRDSRNSITVSSDIFGSSVADSVDTPAKSAPSVTSNSGSNSSIAGIVKNDFWTELESTLKAIIGEGDESYVSLHRQGGIVTVYAPQHKQEEIRKYLNLLKDSAETQVLIEAKILEVALEDQFKSGINWHIMRGDGFTLNKNFDVAGLFSGGVEKSNLKAVAAFIEKFGAVKTLSSPRILVLNNQSALLKVAHNEVVYMPELQKQYGSRDSPNAMDFLSANIKTIPIGLVMTVQPSIDRKNNTVLLNVRPTISKIARYVEVPFFFNNYMRQTGTAQQIETPQLQTQKIPVVDIRELDSVLKINSGQIVVMGGLMHEKSNNGRSGLPGFQDLNYIAGEGEKSTEVTELVIFLRATIIRKKTRTHHASDERLYKKYYSDSRPWRFKK
jgi:general secretion pathway protein D